MVYWFRFILGSLPHGAIGLVQSVIVQTPGLEVTVSDSK